MLPRVAVLCFRSSQTLPCCRKIRRTPSPVCPMTHGNKTENFYQTLEAPFRRSNDLLSFKLFKVLSLVQIDHILFFRRTVFGFAWSLKAHPCRIATMEFGAPAAPTRPNVRPVQRQESAARQLVSLSRTQDLASKSAPLRQRLHQERLAHMPHSRAICLATMCRGCG